MNTIRTLTISFSLFLVVEPVEETVGDFHSSVRQFSPYMPSVQNQFYPGYEAGYGSSTTPEPSPEPFIDPATPTNVTVIKGKSAMLACVVRDVGTAAVIEFASLFC